MIRGSCLCQGVRFEIDGAVSDMTDCHCSMCRKAHGASFVTFVSADPDDFRWVRGEDLITRYNATAALDRPFCRVCGSNLPLYYAKLNEMAIPAMPARPVRPMRCTYDSGSSGTSKLKT